MKNGGLLCHMTWLPLELVMPPLRPHSTRSRLVSRLDRVSSAIAVPDVYSLRLIRSHQRRPLSR